MSSERILVVEDDTAIADLVRTYLEAGSFQVRVARDGRAALDAITSYRSTREPPRKQSVASAHAA